MEEDSYLVVATAEDGITIASYELRVLKSCEMGMFYDEQVDECRSELGMLVSSRIMV